MQRFSEVLSRKRQIGYDILPFRHLTCRANQDHIVDDSPYRLVLLDHQETGNGCTCTDACVCFSGHGIDIMRDDKQLIVSSVFEHFCIRACMQPHVACAKELDGWLMTRRTHLRL